MSRLDLVDEALDQALRVVDARRRRSAVIAACCLAAEAWLSEDALLRRAVLALDGGPPPPDQIEFEAHVQALDTAYWDAQDAGAADERQRFGHARAAAAVLTALFHSEDEEAAGEAIYEAHHAVEAIGSDDALSAARNALTDQ